MTVSHRPSSAPTWSALIEQELLGPRNGPTEEIKGTPRAAYTVGGSRAGHHRPALLGRRRSVPTRAQTPHETGLGVSDIDPVTNGQRGVPVPTDEESGTPRTTRSATRARRAR